MSSDQHKQILSHHAFLNRLARRLAQDEADADDLVQETWLTALTRPPRGSVGLRSWFATVASRLAGRQKRRRRRRLEREAEHARTERDDGGIGAVDRRLDAQALLIERLRRLPPDQRTVLGLRYNDELTPREIAARLGVLENTVRARLRRAIGALREDMDRRAASRSEWVLALLPGAEGWGTAPPAVPAGKGTLIAKLCWASLALVGIAALGDWIWLHGTRGVEAFSDAQGPHPDELGEFLEDPRQPLARSRREALDAKELPADVAVARASGTKVPPVGSGLNTLVGAVRGPGGEPLERARLSLGTPDGEVLWCAAEGTLAEFRFAKLGPGKYRLSAEETAHYRLEVEFELPGPARTIRRDLELVPCQRVVVRVQRLDGRPLLEEATHAGSRMVITDPMEALRACLVSDRPRAIALSSPPRLDEWSFELESASVSHFERPQGSPPNELPPDAVGILVLDEPPPATACLVLASALLATQPIRKDQEELLFVVDPAQLAASMGEVRLRLVDANTGAPVMGSVHLDHPGSLLSAYRVAGDGSFTFYFVLPGQRQIEIRSKSHFGGRRLIRLRPGERLDLGDVPLKPGRTIHGSTLDAVGSSVEGVLLEALVDDGGGRFVELPPNLRYASGSDAEGNFTFHGLPRGRIVLRAHRWNARGRGELCASPVLVDTDGDPWVVVRMLPVVEVEFQTRDGAPWRSLRILNTDGMPVHRGNVDVAEPSLLLPAGEYVADVEEADGTQLRVPFVVGEDSLVVPLETRRIP